MVISGKCSDTYFNNEKQYWTEERPSSLHMYTDCALKKQLTYLSDALNTSLQGDDNNIQYKDKIILFTGKVELRQGTMGKANSGMFPTSKQLVARSNPWISEDVKTCILVTYEIACL